MRYSTGLKYRTYVESYDFLSFPRKFEDRYGKKLADTATNTGIDAAKTVFKRVVKKKEATGNLIGNKMADKITSVDKTKCKEDQRQKILILSDKRQQIIDDLRLF